MGFSELWNQIISSPFRLAILIFVAGFLLSFVFVYSTHSITVGSWKLSWEEINDSPFTKAFLSVGAAVWVLVLIFGFWPLALIETGPNTIEFVDSIYAVVIYVCYGLFIAGTMIASTIHNNGNESAGNIFGTVCGVLCAVTIVIVLLIAKFGAGYLVFG